MQLGIMNPGQFIRSRSMTLADYMSLKYSQRIKAAATAGNDSTGISVDRKKAVETILNNLPLLVRGKVKIPCLQSAAVASPKPELRRKPGREQSVAGLCSGDNYDAYDFDDYDSDLMSVKVGPSRYYAECGDRRDQMFRKKSWYGSEVRGKNPATRLKQRDLFRFAMA